MLKLAFTLLLVVLNAFNAVSCASKPEDPSSATTETAAPAQPSAAASASSSKEPAPAIHRAGGAAGTGAAGTARAPQTAQPANAMAAPASGAAGSPANASTATTAGSGGNVSTAGASAAGSGGSGAPITTAGGGSLQDAKATVAAMGIGWNLGNSLDAVGGETSWGNPMVTPELLKAVAAAGFGAVRVPVTWVMHFAAAPSFTIDPAWMARVEQVVGYVIDNGMYAIINVHHDGAMGGNGEWLSLRDSAGNMNGQHDMAVQQQFVTLWKQIATHFSKHGDKLLFESMNEIKVGYDKPDPGYYRTINALNQAFVDTVRASGGNNATRCLVVPGYNTNIEYTLEGFSAPKDSAPNRLILTVHYYDPWAFAGSGETHAWGKGSPGADNWGQEDWVDEQLEKLKTKYVSAGLPVIMGEYGAVHQANGQDYRRYYMEYVTKAAVDRGIVPVYWDNGAGNSGSDGFGLFSRQTAQTLYPDIIKAMMRAAKEKYPTSSIAKPRQ